MAKLKQLPDIPGFSRRNDGLLGPLRITADHEHAMTTVLSSMRFQRGRILAKVYANLTVLFRLLLYYADFRDHALFWFWIRIDWGLLQGNDNPPIDTRDIVEFYVQARIRGCRADEERKSLLARLVDAWRQESGKIARLCQNGIDTMGSDVDTRRANWEVLRDNHVDVLMGSKQPACLLGVLLPERTVTSLWKIQQDPLPAELATSPYKLPATGRVVSDIEPNPTSASNATARPNKRMVADGKKQTAKRRKTMGDTPEKIQASKKNKEQRPPVEKTRLAPIQIFESPRRALPLRPQSTDPRTQSHSTSLKPSQENLKSQLGLISFSLKNQEREVEARFEHETTGYIPAASQLTPTRRFQGLERENWNKAEYESRIGELEDKLASLEKRFTQESDWARSIGTFLYDANEKTLGTFRELFRALATLKDVSGALLESEDR